MIDFLKHNLHIHSTFSDGFRSPRDLVERAIADNLDVMGFCDHAFSQKLNENNQITNSIPFYVQSIRNQNEFYQREIVTRVGVEIDVSLQSGIDPKELPFDELNMLDYLVINYTFGLVSLMRLLA